MIIGVITRIRSNNWISIWLGLEVSLVAFIPLISVKSKLNSESCLKYYIVQRIRSIILLMGIIITSINIIYIDFFILIRLLIKLGIIPFHNWILSIIEGISYYPLFLIFTIIKLAPLNILFFLNKNIQVLIWINFIIRAISAVSQNSLKKILCYSSIFNIATCIRCIRDLSIWLSFILIYIISNGLTIFVIIIININFLNQIIIFNYNFINKITIWILVISLGGIPPFYIFIAKIIIIENLFIKKDFITIFLLLIFSLITIFIYIRISLISIMSFSLTPKWIYININYITFIILFFLFSLPIIITFKSLN